MCTCGKERNGGDRDIYKHTYIIDRYTEIHIEIDMDTDTDIDTDMYIYMCTCGKEGNGGD